MKRRINGGEGMYWLGQEKDEEETKLCTVNQERLRWRFCLVHHIEYEKSRLKGNDGFKVGF